MIFRFYSAPDSPVRVSVVGEHVDGQLKVAASRCGKRDNFRRSRGRSIAEGRLRGGKLCATIPMESCNGNQFVEVASRIAEQIVRNPKQIYSE